MAIPDFVKKQGHAHWSMRSASKTYVEEKTLPSRYCQPIPVMDTRWRPKSLLSGMRAKDTHTIHCGHYLAGQQKMHSPYHKAWISLW
ncbi:MAG: hypothetical protein ABIU63_07210 [Chitinophagaceae bacterium]